MRLPQWNTRLMLFSSASAEHFHCVGDLNGAARSGTVPINQSSSDDHLQCVTYRQTGLVAKQCEEALTTLASPPLVVSAESLILRPKCCESNGFRRSSAFALKRSFRHLRGKSGYGTDSHSKDGFSHLCIQYFDSSQTFHA